jgi:hypothetical protein
MPAPTLLILNVFQDPSCRRLCCSPASTAASVKWILKRVQDDGAFVAVR